MNPTTPDMSTNFTAFVNLKNSLQALKNYGLIYKSISREPLENLMIRSSLLQQAPSGNTNLNFGLPTLDLNAFKALAEEKKQTIMSFYNLSTNMMPEYYKQTHETLNSFKSQTEQQDPYKTITSSSIRSGYIDLTPANLMRQSKDNLSFVQKQLNNSLNAREENMSLFRNTSNYSSPQDLYNLNKLIPDNAYAHQGSNSSDYNKDNSSSDKENNKFKNLLLGKKRNNRTLDLTDTISSPNVHSLENNLIITNNEKIFKLKTQELAEDTNSHFDKQTICTACNKEFKSELQLKAHLKTHKIHKEIEVKDEILSFGCEHGNCGLKFKTKGRKLMHHNKQEPECKNEKTGLTKLISQYKEIMAKIANNNTKIKVKENFVKNYQRLSKGLNDNEYFNTLCGNDFS
jgi:hypothetical protein